MKNKQTLTETIGEILSESEISYLKAALITEKSYNAGFNRGYVKGYVNGIVVLGSIAGIAGISYFFGKKKAREMIKEKFNAIYGIGSNFKRRLDNAIEEIQKSLKKFDKDDPCDLDAESKFENYEEFVDHLRNKMKGE